MQVNFFGQVDFDFGPGTYNLTETGNQRDIFISKIDTGGNFIWAKQIGGNSAEELTSITNDKQGNIYITGIFQIYSVHFDPGPGSQHVVYLHKHFPFKARYQR